MQWLDEGQSWTHATGFEAIPMVYDQDTEVLARVQRGLRFGRQPQLLLADYQEMRISHFHRRLDQQLGF